MNRPEAVLQREVAAFLRSYLPDDAWFSAVGHGSRGGGDAGWLRGAQWKAMGAVAGVPDIDIVWQGRSYRIELKTTQGALSAAQRYTITALERAGAQVGVCRSVDAVRAQLIVWGFPLLAEKRSSRIVKALGAALVDQVGLEPTT